jgi:hypothetical protein
VDLGKIEEIKSWPVPKNVLEARSFMGTTRYYRRFIEDFSNVSHPFTS